MRAENGAEKRALRSDNISNARKHALKRFMASCYWRRAGLDERPFGALRKWFTGTVYVHVCA
jgi:hypothetical protein